MREETPFFSVIIPTYNRAQILIKTLQSVLEQTFQNFEVIIIDNGSTDNTEQVIKKVEDNRVHYRWQKGTGSPANPRNQGIKLSRGKWICLLDSDDLWFPNKLAETYKNICQNPKVNILCHTVLRLDVETNLCRKIKVGRRGLNYRKLLLHGNCLVNSAVVFNNRFMKENNLKINESDSFVTCEDYDFWLMFAYKGALFLFIDQPLGLLVINNKENMTSSVNRFFENIEALIKHHAFSIQNFSSNKNRIFHKSLASLYIAKAIKYYKSRKYLDCLKNLFYVFLYNPMKALLFIIDNFPFYSKPNSSLANKSNSLF